MTKKRNLRALRKFSIVIFSALLMVSCVAAIPVLVKYTKSDKGFIAKTQMPVPAEKVYKTILASAEEKAPEVKILERDDKEMMLQATDGVQTATAEVERVSDDWTELVITTSIPEKGKEKEKEFALRIIDNICAKLNEDCEVAE